MNTSQRPTAIDSDVFWDLYFRNRLVRLERRGGSCRGVFFADSNGASGPANLLREPDRRAFEIDLLKLRNYDYANDGRFALLLQRPRRIWDALELVWRKAYPYRDPAPFGKERMSELAEQIRDHFFGLSARRMETVEDAENLLIDMVERYTGKFDHLITALVWLLGEMRERSSAKTVVQVIRNSSYVANPAHVLHFTAVDAAFSALWKINDKALMSELALLMAAANSSGRQKIAALFERLLSKEELMSIDRCGEAYLDPAFWQQAVSSMQKFTPLDADRYDVASVFWELRYLAATRLPSSDLRALADDEVWVVREAVRLRLTG